MKLSVRLKGPPRWGCHRRRRRAPRRCRLGCRCLYPRRCRCCRLVHWLSLHQLVCRGLLAVVPFVLLHRVPWVFTCVSGSYERRVGMLGTGLVHMWVRCLRRLGGGGEGGGEPLPAYISLPRIAPFLLLSMFRAVSNCPRAIPTVSCLISPSQDLSERACLKSRL